MAEPADGRLVVVTPWYPSPDGPYDGVFVREAVRALRWPADRTLVIHLVHTDPERVGAPRRETTDDAQVLRVDVPVPARTPRHEVARAARRALAAAAPPELATAAVVHAHVGVPTAWAVAGLLPPTTRLVTTEHATFLPEVLRTPVGTAMYRQVLERTERHFAVTEVEARRLRRHFPEHREKVVTGGNPVSADRFVPRTTTPRRLDRWLYVGNLTPRKGVDKLVRGLRAWLDRHPDRPTRLRLVGDGPQRAALVRLVEELDLTDRVDLTGPATPDELPRVFADSDVLLHLAAHETFGLTVVEAAMSGLPVVVTTCGGPQETLAHAAGEGLVRFVPVAHAAAALVGAVEALEVSAPAADAGKVRSVLVERYGVDRFADDLTRAYRGEPAYAPPRPGAPTVLGLSLSPRSASRVAQILQEALRCGAHAVLVTSRPGEAAAADPRVRVVDLAPHEGRTLLHGAENLLLRTAPGGVLRAVRGLSGRAARMPGPQARAAARGVNALSVLLERHETVVGRIQERTHRLVHAWADPWRLARYVEHHHLETLMSDGGPDLIVLVDEDALPLAWRLARHLPHAELMTRPTDAAVHHRLLP